MRDQTFRNDHDPRRTTHDERVRAWICFDTHRRRRIGLSTIAAHSLEHDARIGFLLIRKQSLHERCDFRGVCMLERKCLRIHGVEIRRVVQLRNQLLRNREVGRTTDKQQCIRATRWHHFDADRFACCRIDSSSKRLRE